MNVTNQELINTIVRNNNCLERWLMSPQEIKTANAMAKAGLINKGHMDNKQQNVFYYLDGVNGGRK